MNVLGSEPRTADRRFEWTLALVVFVLAMAIQYCADALHVSPAAHHAMDFLIDVLGG